MGIPSRSKRLAKKGELFWRHEHHLTGNDRIEPQIRKTEKTTGGGGFFLLVSWPKQPPQKKRQRKDLCYQMFEEENFPKKKKRDPKCFGRDGKDEMMMEGE